MPTAKAYKDHSGSGSTTVTGEGKTLLQVTASGFVQFFPLRECSQGLLDSFNMVEHISYLRKLHSIVNKVPDDVSASMMVCHGSVVFLSQLATNLLSVLARF